MRILQQEIKNKNFLDDFWTLFCQKLPFSIEIPIVMEVSTNFKADLNNPGPHCSRDLNRKRIVLTI